MTSPTPSGHRVVVDADLMSQDDGGLVGPLQPGNRSLLFAFPAPEAGEEPVPFGAVVERIVGGGPGTRCAAQLLFWHDLAELYALPGVGFDIWYSRVIGRGVVREVLAD